MFNNDTSFTQDALGNVKVMSAEDWITEEEVPDPVINACNEYVIIRPLGIAKKTKSGLYLPEVVRNNTLQLMTVGRIVAVGDHAGKRPGVSPFSVGEYVLFPKHGNNLFEYKGVKLIITNDDAILAKVSKEDVIGSEYSALGAGVSGKEDKKGKL